MSSLQRRRGQLVSIWRTVTTTDRRGNQVSAAVPDGPHQVRAVVLPQRSSRAEVPGQIEIDVVRLLVDPNLEGVELWSRVEYLGQLWDVVAPPSLHYGTRATRHWSIDIRKRPTNG